MPEVKLKENQAERMNIKPDATTLALLDNIPAAFIGTDQNDKMQVYPAFLYDNVTGKAFGSTNPLTTIIVDPTTPTMQAKVSQQLADAFGFVNMLNVQAVLQYYNPSITSPEKVRTPTVWKSALISANGSTAIWTSAVGKKWRLMGMQITLVNGTTAAAASLLKMLDVAADTGIGVQICGAALGAVGTSSIIFNASWQNGVLAAATNTALNVNLSSVLAVAGVFVQVWGTEE